MARAKMHLHLRKGALRKTLHTPAGHNIPLAQIEAAAHSQNALTRKRARLALAMRHWHHKGT